eukprot:GHVU01019301.1.p3 GENE.GHVU01019301.1~~GHVU01019301.1.p3  ORF type:complete len:104 (+),score=8.65 GHVU01019301.1:467-778(+)
MCVCVCVCVSACIKLFPPVERVHCVTATTEKGGPSNTTRRETDRSLLLWLTPACGRGLDVGSRVGRSLLARAVEGSSRAVARLIFLTQLSLLPRSAGRRLKAV